MKKTVTIAIPVYNGEKYIAEALNSIKNQEYKPDKIIICDNQSDDDTINIINQFSKQNSNFDIQLTINEENIGPYNNFTKCKEVCDTDFLVILSSDDRLKPSTIEKQINFYKNHPEYAIVGGNASYVDSEGEVIVEAKIKDDLLFTKGQILELVENTSLWIIPSSIMYNMEIIREIGWWDGKFVGQDERYYPQVLSKHPIAVLKDRLVDFRLHPESDGWKDNVSSFNSKINYFKLNIASADYEPDSERRKKAEKYMKKWASDKSIELGSIVWKKYKRRWIGLKYWFFGIKLSPKSLIQKSTLKTVAKTFLK